MARRELPAELQDLQYRVCGVAYRVHTALGPAMKEETYRKCLVHGLRQAGFLVETEVMIDVEFDGLVLRRALRMDVVVERKVLIEVKARDIPLAVWHSQVLSYMWHSGVPFGLLMNFRVPRLKQGIRPFLNNRVGDRWIPFPLSEDNVDTDP